MEKLLESAMDKSLKDLYKKIENTSLEPIIGPYIKSYMKPEELSSSLDKDANHVECKKSLYYPFKLPIKYLDDKSLHPLSHIVCNDLELAPSVVTTTDSPNPCIYDSLFLPKHDFANKMILGNSFQCINIYFKRNRYFLYFQNNKGENQEHNRN